MQLPRLPSQPDLFGPRLPSFGRLPETVKRQLVARLATLLADTMRRHRASRAGRAGHVE